MEIIQHKELSYSDEMVVSETDKKPWIRKCRYINLRAKN